MNIVLTGASRGIGFEIAKLCIENGHHLICLTRHILPLNSINHPNLLSISTDLNSQESMDKALEIIKERFSSIDCIIHNAGTLVNKEFEKITMAELAKVYQVNVFAPFYMTQQLVTLLGKKNKSHIVNISSIGGFQGSSKFAGLSAYSSSKAALAGLTECLAEEFKDKNITVNCLALGAVQTEMLEESFPGYQAPLQPKEMAQYIYDFAMKGHQFFNGKILPVSLSTP